MCRKPRSSMISAASLATPKAPGSRGPVSSTRARAPHSSACAPATARVRSRSVRIPISRLVVGDGGRADLTVDHFLGGLPIVSSGATVRTSLVIRSDRVLIGSASIKETTLTAYPESSRASSRSRSRVTRSMTSSLIRPSRRSWMTARSLCVEDLREAAAGRPATEPRSRRRRRRRSEPAKRLRRKPIRRRSWSAVSSRTQSSPASSSSRAIARVGGVDARLRLFPLGEVVWPSTPSRRDDESGRVRPWKTRASRR